MSVEQHHSFLTMSKKRRMSIPDPVLRYKLMREFLTVPELFAATLVCRQWNAAASTERDRRVLPLIPRFVKKGDTERQRSAAAMLCTTLLDCASCSIHQDHWASESMLFLRNLLSLDRERPVPLTIARTTTDVFDTAIFTVGLVGDWTKTANHRRLGNGGLIIDVGHGSCVRPVDVAFVDKTLCLSHDRWHSFSDPRVKRRVYEGTELAFWRDELGDAIIAHSGAVLRWILSKV